MYRTTVPLAVLTAAVALAVPSAARGAAAYDACQFEIASLPAVLTTQGTWCVRRPLATTIASGAAITVANNNITIDCNGFRLSGLGAGIETQTTAIVAENRRNLVVRGCHLRGFHTAVRTAVGGGHLLEDNRIEAMTATGLSVASDQSTIRRNFVVDTGGTRDGSRTAIGIDAMYQVDVLDNTVDGVEPWFIAGETAYGYGIRLRYGTHAVIGGNQVRGVSGLAGGSVAGIFVWSTSAAIIEGNRVLTQGIRCTGSAPTSARNTVTHGGVTTCTSREDIVTP